MKTCNFPQMECSLFFCQQDVCQRTFDWIQNKWDDAISGKKKKIFFVVIFPSALFVGTGGKIWWTKRILHAIPWHSTSSVKCLWYDVVSLEGDSMRYFGLNCPHFIHIRIILFYETVKLMTSFQHWSPVLFLLPCDNKPTLWDALISVESFIESIQVC